MNDNSLEYKLDLIAAHFNIYKVEVVASVMRRHHTRAEDGEIVDVVDFYPAWNNSGTYGKMKLAHEYMDEDWQKERFEKFSGIKVDEIPLYEGQTAMVRRFGVTDRREVTVRPFRLMLQPRKDENGNNDKTLILRYQPAPEARRAQTAVTTAQPNLPAQATQTAAAPRPPAAQVSKPQTAVQQPKPAAAPQPAKVEIPAVDWHRQAMQAVDPLDFDHSMGRAVGVTSEEMEALRVAICGQLWHEIRSPAYAAAIEEYHRVVAEVGKEAAIERARDGYRIIADIMTEADRQAMLESADVESFAGRVWALYPEHFESAQKVASLFSSLYAGLKFRTDHTQAYLDGMLACAKSYKSGLATNTDARTAYAAAKLKGQEAYHLTLDLGGRTPPAVTQPRLGVDTANTYSQ